MNRMNVTRESDRPTATFAVRATAAKGRAKRCRCAVHDTTETRDATVCDSTLAASQLLPLVYDDLRKVAARKLAQEKPGQTLDPTALVHEAYLRLVKDAKNGNGQNGEGGWANRRHFFASAAEAMRRILVENARRKGREKHGGGRQREQADLDAPARGGVHATFSRCTRRSSNLLPGSR